MSDTLEGPSVLQAKKIVIVGGEFLQTNNHMRDQMGGNFEEEMQALRNLVSFDAYYDSIKHPYPHHLVLTPAEQDMINTATDWALESNGRQKVLHLDLSTCAMGQYIAQHIAERFEQRSCLLGTFFFCFLQSASHPKKELVHHPKHLLVSTLAYQLCVNLPDTKAAMLGAIRSDPSILTRNIGKQMQRLILEPLQQTGAPKVPNVFVVAVGPEYQDLDSLHVTLTHAVAGGAGDSSDIRFLVLKHGSCGL